MTRIARVIKKHFLYNMDKIKSGTTRIAEERTKQITKHGYTAEHDNAYKSHQLLFAAIAYLKAAIYDKSVGEDDWPFDKKYFKAGTDFVGDLATAGAFIAAEIDRLNLDEQH